MPEAARNFLSQRRRPHIRMLTVKLAKYFAMAVTIAYVLALIAA